MLDVVYPYRADHADCDLRYSLRSLALAQHGRVIVAGDRPRFASEDLICVPVRRSACRYASSRANIVAALSEVNSARVMVMNDDIFLLKPWQFRHENRGTIADYLATCQPKGDYRLMVEATRDLLISEGIQDPIWFGLHTPTVYNRAKLLKLDAQFTGQRFLLRTLYHNLYPRPSTRREDVKMRRWSRPDADLDVLSTADAVTRDPDFMRWIGARFPERSIYERKGFGR